jgi:chemotaxis response regulator CheB
MTRIRILLVALPRLLRDLLGDALASEPDMEILSSDARRAELEGLVRELRPDVVVIGAARDAASAMLTDLRRAAPSIAVLAIAAKGDRATFFTAQGTLVELDDVSMTAIVKAIHDHAAVNGNTKFPPA